MEQRQILNVSAKLRLKSEGGERPDTEFAIEKYLGSGSNASAYIASLNGEKEKCILKELYPMNCGLKRDLAQQVYFAQHSDDEKLLLHQHRQKYAGIKQRYLDSYKLQLKIHNTPELVLNQSTSIPRAVYENENGVLYTAFSYQIGENYLSVTDESLMDILRVIIQLANIVNALHHNVDEEGEADGYLLLDIKESNILIVGSEESCVPMLFDFDSMISLRNLSQTTENLHIRYTDTGDELLLPPELQCIKNAPNCRQRNLLVERLAQTGWKADLFLLGSLLYKRVFGRCPADQEIRFDEKWNLPESHFVHSESCRKCLKVILSKAMAYRLKDRYDSMQEFIADLRKLLNLAFCENPEICKQLQDSGWNLQYTDVSRDVLESISGARWEQLGKSGKFSQLRKLKIRFDSRVCLLDDENTLSSPAEVFANHKPVFLRGEGGMGKSTALYDYWDQQLHGIGIANRKICFYIDLSSYQKIEGHNNAGLSILVHIVNYILRDNSALDVVEAADDGVQREQRKALLNLFTQTTEEPEYMLLLDGYNEILRSADRFGFCTDIQAIMDNWKNVQVILTGRTLPENRDDPLKVILPSFKIYTFTGVSEDEIRRYLQKRFGKISEVTEQDDLWKILHIPMFLSMFLQLQDTKEIHTRGEILDAYICSEEMNTAGRISQAATGVNTHQIYRQFVITHALPFAANRMDYERKSHIDSMEVMKRAWDIYCDDEEINDRYTDPQTPYGDLDEQYAMKKVRKILLDETCYCIRANGKYSFTHQYYRDYFAAKHIQNILEAMKATGGDAETRLAFINDSKKGNLNYAWSDDVALLLGEITGDYRCVPAKEGLHAQQ